MKHLFTLYSALFFVLTSSAQAPSIEWHKWFGGTAWDYGNSVCPSPDGGYVFVGRTASNDGDITVSHNDSSGNVGDMWVFKLNRTGDMEWQKCLGGKSNDLGSQILPATDSGYIVLGQTSSEDGDVIGFGNTDNNSWLLKLNSLGAIQWQRVLKGSNNDHMNSIKSTKDGGYIAAGYSRPANGKTGYEGALFKWDVSGNLLWTKYYGSHKDDYLNYAQQTKDGGYIAVGQSPADTNMGSLNSGACWVIKVNETGDLEWGKTFGEWGTDVALSVIEAQGGGYLVNCYFHEVRFSNEAHGAREAVIVKLDHTGEVLWKKFYGGSRWEEAARFISTSDGGFMLCGYTTSNDYQASGGHGGYDGWLVKLDANFEEVWHLCLGGSKIDHLRDIYQTMDNGYILAGYTQSMDGDLINRQYPLSLSEQTDLWVIKLESDGTSSSEEDLTTSSIATIYPNPVENILTVIFASPEQDIHITNLIGEILYREKATSGRKEIDVSHLASGMYFVNNRKFVKE